MQVRVLGPIEIVGSSGDSIPVTGSKMRGFMAVLALEAGSTIPPQRLIDALWGDRPVNGPNVVQVVVSKLRRVLSAAGEVERITTKPSGYQLEVRRDAVDVLRFEALLDEARTADPTAVANGLRTALDLWRGAPLADAPDTELIGTIRARLEELRRVAVEDLVDAELALGHHHRLSAELESLVAAEPLRERRWGQLMRALYGSGQQAEALRAFQRARGVLVEQMGVEPSPELRRLEAAVLSQDESVLGAARPAAASLPVGEGFRRRGNVRHPVGTCVGRKEDLERLVDLVERHRLVTLTGPGGVGKTRLALEAAIALKDEVPDGVWWIDLAAARNRADVLAAVQRALQLEPTGGGDPAAALDQVVSVLDEQAALFVLDNCEQLFGSIEVLVTDLLGHCGSMRVIATSRGALGVDGELVFTVAPLELTAAMALFEERIEGLAAEHEGGGGGGPTGTIAEICERLDRLPLALELAAARARHLSLVEILERLTDRFDLLRGRSGPPDHRRDLRAVADWSYELLDGDERRVFERLSVFADGATVRAAQRVCGGGGTTDADVEDLLGRLVDKSLIFADRSGVETRYRMLQTLYDYAGDRLRDRGDEEVRRAHALWVRELAEGVRFGSPTTGAAVAAVQDEDVAVGNAIEWALTADPQLALDICTSLAPFWFGTMRVSAGWQLLSSALEAAGDADAPPPAAPLPWAVVFSTMVHDVETAERLAREAMAFELDVGDPARLGQLCFALALAAGYREGDGADDWIGEARRHFTAAGSAIGLAHVSFAEGAVRLVRGDPEGAATSLRAAIDGFRAHEDHLGLILAVSRLGELAWRIGDLQLFADMHAELLGLGRASRSSAVVIGATARLAHARLEQGALDEAQALAAEALASSSESFMPVVNGYTFRTAGLVNLRMGHVAEGRAQLRAAIEAFGRGAGNVGTGQAALCWIDLSTSFAAAGDRGGALRSAAAAVEAAVASGDPWVRLQADANYDAIDR